MFAQTFNLDIYFTHGIVVLGEMECLYTVVVQSLIANVHENLRQIDMFTLSVHMFTVNSVAFSLRLNGILQLCPCVLLKY